MKQTTKDRILNSRIEFRDKVTSMFKGSELAFKVPGKGRLNRVNRTNKWFNVDQAISKLESLGVSVDQKEKSINISKNPVGLSSWGIIDYLTANKFHVVKSK